MATAPWNATEAPPISVEVYLRTTYRPDCDFVDGIVEERNSGEYDHSQLQGELIFLFIHQKAEWGITVLPEGRLQVAAQRFRVPDIMILRNTQKVDRIVREAPLLCIEVLSPEDTWTKMRARLNDYLALGVEHLWCFDPDAREARRYTTTGFEVVSTPEMIVPGTPIRLVVANIFSVLDIR